MRNRKAQPRIRWQLDVSADLAERVERLAGATAPSRQEWLIWAVTAQVDREEARWAIPSGVQEVTR